MFLNIWNCNEKCLHWLSPARKLLKRSYAEQRKAHAIQTTTITGRANRSITGPRDWRWKGHLAVVEAPVCPPGKWKESNSALSSNPHTNSAAKNLFLDTETEIRREEGKLQSLSDPHSSCIQLGYSFCLFSDFKALPKTISHSSEGFPSLSQEKDLGALELWWWKSQQLHFWRCMTLGKYLVFLKTEFVAGKTGLIAVTEKLWRLQHITQYPALTRTLVSALCLLWAYCTKPLGPGWVCKFVLSKTWPLLSYWWFVLPTIHLPH